MLNAGGYSATFSYAPDRRRWRQVSTYASGTETTIYVGEQLEKLTTPVRTHWKHRLPTPSGEVQVIRRSDGTTETLYLAADHLGSVDAVTNAAGTVLARPSFNAWGGRRGSNWQGAPSQSEWQAIADTTRRGYTGHEQLDNVMLVHMNGRVYDPAIGRFLSADPFIDCAESTQGWNRYSYVKNSPLAFTDPSGFSRMPPSPAIMKIDPGGLEEIFVDASRLKEIFDNFRVGIALNFGITRVSAPAVVDGGGGQSGGDGAKQQEEEFKNCVNKCMDRKAPYIFASTAAAAAATTGNVAVTVLAGGAGFLAGVAQINGQSALTSLPFSAAAGHVAATFDQPSAVSVFVSGPVAAIASDLAGTQFGGLRGASASAAAGGAVESLPAAVSLLRSGESLAAVRRLALGTTAPALAAMIGFTLATGLAQSGCESECSGP